MEGRPDEHGSWCHCYRMAISSDFGKWQSEGDKMWPDVVSMFRRGRENWEQSTADKRVDPPEGPSGTVAMIAAMIASIRLDEVGA